VLREDDRAIVRAASAASKAADYLLAFRSDPSESIDTIEMGYELEMA
jgi:antirestriction protein ArdC